MPKRSHLLLLTIAVDAALLMGAVQAQAEEQEDEPPLIIQIHDHLSSSTISHTLSAPNFPSLPTLPSNQNQK
jgi:hypothetical protein